MIKPPSPNRVRVHCAMVGPHPREQGGVSAVVAELEAAGLFGSGACSRLDSFVAGSAPTKAWAALMALSKLLLLILRGRAQVVHVHVSSHASFWRKALFIALARLARRQVVFHLHGGGFQAFYEGLPSFQRRLAAITMRQCSRLLCLSSPAQALLESIAPGVPAQWWPNPVPVPAVGEMATDCEADTILFLGALTEAKGVDQLLRAFGRLHEQVPAARLVVAGDGPNRARLEALADALGLAPVCRFAGWVRGAKKANLLSQARLLVLPSRMEAQPVVLLEAMAAHVPVLASAVGGVPDLVCHGVSGWLVPVDDEPALARAMIALWLDRALRERLAEKGARYVAETHATPLVVQRHLALYQSLSESRANSD